MYIKGLKNQKFRGHRVKFMKDGIYVTTHREDCDHKHFFYRK